jgi:serine/threonine-protein kinase
MELLSGGSVADRIRGRQQIPYGQAIQWLSDAGEALDAAHEAEIVHRDVKPGNMLLDRRGRLALADFGIARLAWEDQLTLTGQVLGTAAYISPEQAMGKSATAASDRYALAIVAFELLTGAKPFEAEHFAAQARAHVEDPPPLATDIDSSLPRGVDPVLERGMAKEPSERWESAAAMVDALERAMGSARAPTEATRPMAAIPPPPPPPPAPARAAATGGRRNAAPLLVGLAALALLAVVAVLLFSGGGENPSDSKRQTNTQRTQKRKATPTPTAKPKAKAEATPTPTATPTSTATPTPAPGSGVDLARARQLQLAGFNARKAGDYQTALNDSSAALKACGDTHALDPCGYALYEIGADLIALGRNEEAIPFLEKRLSEYGDNSSGEVQRALDQARGETGGKKPKKSKGHGHD